MNVHPQPQKIGYVVDCVYFRNCIYGSSLTLTKWWPQILFLNVLCNDKDEIGPRSVTFPLGTAYVLCQNISLEIVLLAEIFYIKYKRPQTTTNTDSTLMSTNTPQKYSKDDISTQFQ